MLLHSDAPWVRLPTRVLIRVAFSVPAASSVPDEFYFSSSSPPSPLPPPPTPAVTARLADILGTAQRRALCLRLAEKRLARTSHGDSALDRFVKDIFHSAKDEARKIERTEDAGIVLREGMTLHDLLECEISIAQIYQYWAPDFATLRRLVPQYRDLLSHRHLLNVILLVQLYDPAELLTLFHIDATSLPCYPLPGPELLALGFAFTEATFFRTVQALRASGLSPDDCVDLDVTPNMLAHLGITPNTTDMGYRANRLAATGWSASAFQRAFNAPGGEGSI